jgi:hypothetical protein
MMLMAVPAAQWTRRRLAEPLMGGFETPLRNCRLLAFANFVFLFGFNFASLLTEISRT